ncbi:unnamed protein product [Haemonchus placei]|uniref:Uncharacterized protein n=1 Tax=Haemonchus placei TaxID=6290 RepID=A0A0N4WLB6_HAEPC|nr:unnamed protein product [Haemonchus placei]
MHPIHFAYKSLSEPKRRRHITELKALAVDDLSPILRKFIQEQQCIDKGAEMTLQVAEVWLRKTVCEIESKCVRSKAKCLYSPVRTCKSANEIVTDTAISHISKISHKCCDSQEMAKANCNANVIVML